jgi:hypothetical protein
MLINEVQKEPVCAILAGGWSGAISPTGSVFQRIALIAASMMARGHEIQKADGGTLFLDEVGDNEPSPTRIVAFATATPKDQDSVAECQPPR